MKATPVVDGKKRCSGCHRTRPLAEFTRMSRTPSGDYLCKPCRHLYINNLNKSEAHRQHLADYHRAHPKDALRRHLFNGYGLTIEAFEQMVTRQDGRCAACGSLPTRARLDVDHDHATGKVRGLLCNPCNLALGHVGHDLERLRQLITYLNGGL